jgi:hypothetical protein
VHVDGSKETNQDKISTRTGYQGLSFTHFKTRKIKGFGGHERKTFAHVSLTNLFLRIQKSFGVQKIRWYTFVGRRRRINEDNTNELDLKD